MIKMQCIVECEECERQDPMTIDVKGEFDIGKQKTVHIGSIYMPDGWGYYREPYYYGKHEDKTLCPVCYPDKSKAWER